MLQDARHEATVSQWVPDNPLRSESMDPPQEVFQRFLDYIDASATNDNRHRYYEYPSNSNPSSLHSGNQYAYIQGVSQRWSPTANTQVVQSSNFTDLEIAYGPTSPPRDGFQFDLVHPHPYSHPIPYSNAPASNLQDCHPQSFFPRHPTHEYSNKNVSQPTLQGPVQEYQQPNSVSMAQSVISGSARGLHIPQRAYQPQRTGYLRRSTKSFHLDPIEFVVDGLSGILVSDALQGKFSGLDRSYDQMGLNGGAPISLRFEWPGYSSYYCQIATRDSRKNPNPITRAKLANRVARKLELYINSVEKDGGTVAEDNVLWRLGRGYIDTDRLVLVRLDKITNASYQPQFRLTN